jgi:hypothetical protein
MLFRAGALWPGDALMYFLYPMHLWAQMPRSNSDVFIGLEAGGKTKGIVDASPVGPNFVGRLTFGLLLPQG